MILSGCSSAPTEVAFVAGAGGPLFHGTERNKLKHYFTERNGTDRKLILHVISSKRHVIKPGMGNSFGIH